jgi:hypothetical protein
MVFIVSPVIVDVSPPVVDSPLLLQATNAPAITITAKNFFIVLGFWFIMWAKIGALPNTANFEEEILPTV